MQTLVVVEGLWWQRSWILMEIVVEVSVNSVYRTVVGMMIL